MKKINLYGGPGIGKSTVASLIYAQLKAEGKSAEMITEYAKDLVYQGLDLKKSNQNLQDQIITEQLRRELLCKDQVDFMVCDSPLLLNAFYNGSDNSLVLAKQQLRKNDLHFFLTRTTEHFETQGRSHNEKQSIEIDLKMETFLKENGIQYVKIDGDSRTKADTILNILGL